MITRQELEGQWSQIKGQIQERWGSLTDDELQQAQGNTNQLVGVIQQHTGESRRAIEDFLEELVSNSEGAGHQAVETAKEYMNQASETARRGYDQAAAGLNKGYEQVAAGMNKGYDQVSANVNAGLGQAQDTVRRHPMESLAVVFGAGLIVGVVTGLCLRSR